MREITNTVFRFSELRSKNTFIIKKCIIYGNALIDSYCFSVPKNYRAPRFLESLRAVLTEEGLVSFECKVVGYPTPHLQWFKDGQELKPGDVYQLTGTNSLGIIWILLIIFMIVTCI